jgi:hypothetical protein
MDSTRTPVSLFLGPPSIALHHTFQLGPSVRRHAEAIDADVADLVHAVARAQAPIDLDRAASGTIIMSNEPP